MIELFTDRREKRKKEKNLLIERENNTMPVTKQAQLLGIFRSTVYYKPRVNSYNLKLIHLIDEQYTETPFYGFRRVREALRRKGYEVNRKRVQRLMKLFVMLKKELAGI